MKNRLAFLALWVVVAAGCSVADAPTATAPPASAEQLTAYPIFDHYVAMGTSVSMGVAAQGVLASSQYQSWPAQLSRLAGHPMSLPLISGVGCPSPFKVPLISFVRQSGESVATPSDQLICSPLAEGVKLPAQNVAINGAKTSDALLMTPQNKPDVYGRNVYSRVLPPNTTQVGAMLMQSPRLVSVEFGANEVLGVTSGAVIPGVTYVPFAVWQPFFRELVDSVAKVAKKALLVTLTSDAEDFPGFRRGAEIWNDRLSLLNNFNVDVSSNCQANANLIFVPARVPGAVAAGLANKQRGLPPVPFSCADLGANVVDGVLTPADVAFVNALLAQMNTEIAQTALQRGYAHFELEALYGRPSLKGPFRAFEMMMSLNPYGPFISADGVHPSALGQSVLAHAAAEALNAKYRANIATFSFIATR
jgi:hypothetical protein